MRGRWRKPAWLTRFSHVPPPRRQRSAQSEATSSNLGAPTERTPRKRGAFCFQPTRAPSPVVAELVPPNAGASAVARGLTAARTRQILGPCCAGCSAWYVAVTAGRRRRTPAVPSRCARAAASSGTNVAARTPRCTRSRRSDRSAPLNQQVIFARAGTGPRPPPPRAETPALTVELGVAGYTQNHHHDFTMQERRDTKQRFVSRFRSGDGCSRWARVASAGEHHPARLSRSGRKPGYAVACHANACARCGKVSHRGKSSSRPSSGLGVA